MRCVGELYDCIAVGSFTMRKAWVSGESSPVAKDSFNPPPLVLKARAPTMPCLASWLSGVAALHFPGIRECC